MAEKKFHSPHVLLPNKLEEAVRDWEEREPEQRDQLDYFKTSSRIDTLLECIREMDISLEHVPEVVTRLEGIGRDSVAFGFAIGSAASALKERVAKQN